MASSASPSTSGRATPQSETYLDLLAGTLSRTVIPETYRPFGGPSKLVYRWLYRAIRGALRKKNISLVRNYQAELSSNTR